MKKNTRGYALLEVVISIAVFGLFMLSTSDTFQYNIESLGQVKTEMNVRSLTLDTIGYLNVYKKSYGTFDFKKLFSDLECNGYTTTQFEGGCFYYPYLKNQKVYFEKFDVTDLDNIGLPENITNGNDYGLYFRDVGLDGFESVLYLKQINEDEFQIHVFSSKGKVTYNKSLIIK